MNRPILKYFKYCIQLVDDKEANIRDSVTTVTGSIIAQNELNAIDIACNDAIKEFKKRKKVINYQIEEI